MCICMCTCMSVCVYACMGEWGRGVIGLVCRVVNQRRYDTVDLYSGFTLMIYSD